MASLVALTSLVTAEPAFAQTNLESFGNAVLGLLSNGLLRIVAILALIAAGFGWLTGRVNTGALVRSEEHTSELQSLMRNSYAVFCLKKKNTRSKDRIKINSKK